jgi:hypothetical protein
MNGATAVTRRLRDRAQRDLDAAIDVLGGENYSTQYLKPGYFKARDFTAEERRLLDELCAASRLEDGLLRAWWRLYERGERWQALLAFLVSRARRERGQALAALGASLMPADAHRAEPASPLIALADVIARHGPPTRAPRSPISAVEAIAA